MLSNVFSQSDEPLVGGGLTGGGAINRLGFAAELEVGGVVACGGT